MNDKTVLLACPVRNREHYLPYYLDHIIRIDYPKKLINILWVINNSQDNSEQILQKFKSQHEHEYNSITIDHYNKNRNVPHYDRTAKNKIHIDAKGNKTVVPDDSIKTIYSHLAVLRNHIMRKVETDYLLSIDSDILVPPDILTKLLSHKQKICAGLIYNGFLINQQEPWRFPNIMRKLSNGIYEHIANSYVKNAPTLTESKLIRVSLTGAVVLMDREVCKNTKYAYHPQGEDAAWSVDCETKGYELYADYSAYCFHAMNEEMLQKYLKGEI